MFNISDFLTENLKEFLKNTNINIKNLIEDKKNIEGSDFSLPCFIFSKNIQKKPNEISEIFKQHLEKKSPKEINKFVANGPFLDIYLNKEIWTKNLINYILSKKYLIDIKKGEKEIINIEFPSPNTNKYLHIGHSRNMITGNSLKNLLKIRGHKIICTNVNNDRGIAICKAMLAYELFGEDKNPDDLDMRGDEFVSHFYVLFGKKSKENPNLEKKAQDMLLKWENGDSKTIKLWKKIQKWVQEGYKITYKNYKIKKFDKEYFESKIYKKGKDIVLNALNEKVPNFKKEKDGAIYYDFNDKTYGKKYLLRGDGTSMYVIQDLYLAEIKKKDFGKTKSIFVVSEEQKYHFEVLFKLLEILKISDEKDNHHLAYGFVFNEKGEKYSSRNGDIIGADEVLKLLEKKAYTNLLEKNFSKTDKQNDLEKKAKKIAYAALSFTFLKVNTKSPINFSIDKALSFEGESGPYIQYTYARIKSIIKKSNLNETQIKTLKLDLKNINPQIIMLLKKIEDYPKQIIIASEKYKMSSVAIYLLNLAQTFNKFYQNTPINKESNIKLKEIYLMVSLLISEILKEGLLILDIDVLEEM
jgi:arginyl-tRNA synthetase